MIDREKVIKGLECCMVSYEDRLLYQCDDCPYRATENERKVIDWRCHLEELRSDALELMKGQRPVMPVLVPKGHGAGVGYDCGACGTELIVLRGTVDMKTVHEQVRFCRMCGKAVKWDA